MTATHALASVSSNRLTADGGNQDNAFARLLTLARAPATEPNGVPTCTPNLSGIRPKLTGSRWY